MSISASEFWLDIAGKFWLELIQLLTSGFLGSVSLNLISYLPIVSDAAMNSKSLQTNCPGLWLAARKCL